MKEKWSHSLDMMGRKEDCPRGLGFFSRARPQMLAHQAETTSERRSPCARLGGRRMSIERTEPGGTATVAGGWRGSIGVPSIGAVCRLEKVVHRRLSLVSSLSEMEGGHP